MFQCNQLTPKKAFFNGRFNHQWFLLNTYQFYYYNKMMWDLNINKTQHSKPTLSHVWQNMTISSLKHQLNPSWNISNTKVTKISVQSTHFLFAFVGFIWIWCIIAISVFGFYIKCVDCTDIFVTFVFEIFQEGFSWCLCERYHVPQNVFLVYLKLVCKMPLSQYWQTPGRWLPTTETEDSVIQCAQANLLIWLMWWNSRDRRRWLSCHQLQTTLVHHLRFTTSNVTSVTEIRSARTCLFAGRWRPWWVLL